MMIKSTFGLKFENQVMVCIVHLLKLPSLADTLVYLLGLNIYRVWYDLF